METDTEGRSFLPKDLSLDAPTFSLSEGTWVSILETPCTFNPECFLEVMLNFVKNPNITSSHLFRADIFYDSLNDTSVSEDATSEHFSGFTKHMKSEYRPLRIAVPGFERHRTMVRQMVPRNPKLDKPLVQTCHFLKAHSKGDLEGEVENEKNLVIYLPHVAAVDALPWYHPAIKAMAIMHIWTQSSRRAKLSIHYQLFPDSTLEDRMTRTALNFLQTVHKHGRGGQAGYVKRVNHDQIVPQAVLQDTYSRLKAKYAKGLIENWVEQTPPEKHVFEDLGIAAFLIELWRKMYRIGIETQDESEGSKPVFPGYIDIGCGNGVLVYILYQEGYQGWGFDARRRKTWNTFPAEVQSILKEMILVPEVFLTSVEKAMSTHAAETEQAKNGPERSDVNEMCFDVSSLSLLTNPSSSVHAAVHNGIFPKGTFIVSNHADQLTAWTPLLAYLSCSSFIAIPCCSYNLAGIRFRAPVTVCQPLAKGSEAEAGVMHKAASVQSNGESHQNQPLRNAMAPSPAKSGVSPQVDTRQKLTPKPPSAYASLCAYVNSLASAVDYLPEREMLRIPSTRNAAIVGRRQVDETAAGLEDDAFREQRIREVVEKELVREGGLQNAAEEWIMRTAQLAAGKGKGH